MIVVAIIGILAAIAIPQYRDYVVASHGGAAMKVLLGYVPKAQACVETSFGCTTLNSEVGGEAGFGGVASHFKKGVGGTLTWTDGTASNNCHVSAIVTPSGGVTYSAVGHGSYATGLCRQRAGLGS